MEKEKTKPKKSTVVRAEATAQPELANATAATTAATPAPDVPMEQRENARINEKIDEWIKRFPNKWSYFTSLPPERMARKLVLNEIDKYERQQEQQDSASAPRYDRNQSNSNGMRAK